MPFTASAIVRATDRLLWIMTQSGRTSPRVDPLGSNVVLPPTCSDAALGQAALEAARASRCVEESRESSLHRDDVVEAMRARVASLLKAHGYTSRGALFARMRACEVKLGSEEIACEPLRHQGAELWVGMPGEAVRVPAGASPDEVGRAIRGALARATE